MAKANTKQTSKAMASKASKLLSKSSSPARVKSVAASALSQTRPSRKTK